MKITLLSAMSFLSVVWCSSINAQSTTQAITQPEDELDLLMRVVNEDDTPDTIINRILLPPVYVKKTLLNEGDLADIDARTPQGNADELVEYIDRTITDTVSGNIVSGEISDLPSDILDVLPAEDIEDIVNGVVDAGNIAEDLNVDL